MISARKMDAANVEAVLKRDVELVAANEALARLADWEGPGAVEYGRELYEKTAREAEEHASAERELRADLETAGARLQAEIAKLSQAQVSLDHGRMRRAELERELHTANAEVANVEAQLYTLRGLQKKWEAAMRELFGKRATTFREALLLVGQTMGALTMCRLFVQRVAADKTISGSEKLPGMVRALLREVIDPALEGLPDPQDGEPGV